MMKEEWGVNFKKIHHEEHEGHEEKKFMRPFGWGGKNE
jgi:hypothetical protein